MERDVVMGQKVHKIKFIHSDGKEYVFEYALNALNGMWMYTFNNWRNCYASDKRHINSIIRDLPK